MPTRNVNLTDHFDRFIEAGVRSGRFSNASEVVRQGLRLLEQQEQEDKAKLEWLRAAAKEGFDAIERGDYVTLRSPQEIEEFVRQIGEEVSADLLASPIVAKRPRFEVRVTGLARRDIATILNWSRKELAKPQRSAIKSSLSKPCKTSVTIRTARLEGAAGDHDQGRADLSP